MNARALCWVALGLWTAPSHAFREQRLFPVELAARLFEPAPESSLVVLEFAFTNLSPRDQSVSVALGTETADVSIFRASSPGGGWTTGGSNRYEAAGITLTRVSKKKSLLLRARTATSTQHYGRISFHVCCVWKPAGLVCNEYAGDACPGTSVSNVQGSLSRYSLSGVVVRVDEDQGGILGWVTMTHFLRGTVGPNVTLDRLHLDLNRGRAF